MSDTPTGFASLGLPFNILRAIEEQGYETPSPIQQQSIPHLLEGKDVLGLAQTGTGKTAAFTLPILARTDANARAPQVLVLAPTRELAQQVAQAVESYAKHVPGIRTTCIYGGQDFSTQFRALKSGPQFVVGTPGRVMDHIRRGTLKLDDIKAVVLDEADEMLRMGFIDDVNWILDHVPSQRQVALFSATMPRQIKEVAEKHLNSPVEVRIENKTATNEKIAQSFWLVRNLDKNEALLRICETQETDAIMIFVRTKQATEEVADYLRNAGYKCEALNGDVAQAQRERAVDRLKKGQIDIVAATDVAARGLDVERISHVINYDIPYDAESYVHRIGRTGRAGRTGNAILFVRPRERRMLSTIERVTRHKIAEMQMPTIDEVNAKRRERFKGQILESLGGKDVEIFKGIVSEVLKENEALDPVEVAAAVAHMAQGGKSLFLTEQPRKPRGERNDREERGGRGERGRDARGGRERGRGRDMADKPLDKKPMPLKDNPDVEMKRYRLAVGYKDGVKPGNIVGAIANEANIESKFIGHIEIFDGFATVDLPSGMPSEVVNHLKKTRICGRPLNIEDINAKGGDAPKRAKKEGYKAKDGSGTKSRNRKPAAKRKESSAQ